MPKKSNTKRADGRIAVQVYIGRVDGKRKYKTVYGSTQKEADKKAEELKIKLNKGIDLTRSNDSFSVWAEHFLTSKKCEVSDDQYNLIESRVKVWQNHFGYMKISEVLPMYIQQVINELCLCNPYTGKPTARRTLTAYINVLKNIFDFAVDNRVVDFNPALRVKPPKTAEVSERRALSSVERERIIEFEHRGQRAMMLLMLSGLRRGEATALLWSDIDFKNKTISVTKSYNFKQNTLKAPKNGKSRIVSVPTVLIDYLSKAERTSPYVITTANNTMMTESAWKRLLESYIADMNLEYGTFIKPVKKFSPTKASMMIEPFTYHCLRHTFCTMMYEAGIDVLVAQEQMGHSDPKTTLAIYTHLQKEHKINNISQLDSYLNSNASQMQVKQEI